MDNAEPKRRGRPPKAVQAPDDARRIVRVRCIVPNVWTHDGQRLENGQEVEMAQEDADILGSAVEVIE